jgi:hypothetical protein
MDIAMHEAIRTMLDRYACQTRDDYANALREILQELALLGLWRGKFFEHAAFYGGTALRVLYGLDRYSADLDFSLLARTPPGQRAIRHQHGLTRRPKRTFIFPIVHFFVGRIDDMRLHDCAVSDRG